MDAETRCPPKEQGASPQGPLEVFLFQSGLSPSDVPTWTYVEKFRLNALLGIPEGKIVSDGIAIPYRHFDGGALNVNGSPFVRVRLLAERYKSSKYRSPAGTGSHLYIPCRLKELLDAFPSSSESSSQPPEGASTGRQESIPPFVITEGEKKAEALCKAGLPTVAIAGIHMGNVRDDPDDTASPRRLLPDIREIIGKYIAAAGEQAVVLVLFDSDGAPHGAPASDKDKPVGKGKRQQYVGNQDVYWECLKLAKAIREEFARQGLPVAGNWCPPTQEGGKQGIDDWLVRDGRDAVIPAIIHMTAASRSANVERLASSRKRAEEAKAGGYAALGFTKEHLVIWSRPTKSVKHLTPTNLSKVAEIMHACGAAYAMETWKKIGKDDAVSIDAFQAGYDIVSQCHAAGPWADARERGGGVWREVEGQLTINSSSGLLRTSEEGLVLLEEEARFGGQYVYPATSRFHVDVGVEWTDDEALESAARLLRHLSQWGWAGKADALLLAGWIVAQSYLGALDARPSVTLCGESGAGKSVLALHVSEVLGGTVWRLDDGANSSAAGLRQLLGKDAVTLLVDESEPGSSDTQVAHQRAAMLRRVLDMLRAAYSTSDGSRALAAVKGSPDGRPVEFSIRTAAMIAAIGRPDFEQADRNRFIVVEVAKRGRAEHPPSTIGLGELGERIRHIMWSRWETFREIYSFLVEEGTKVTEADARLLRTWGVPLAAFATLSYGEETLKTEERRQKLLSSLQDVAKEQQHASGNDALETDAEKALRALLGARMAVEVETVNPETGHRSVLRHDRVVAEVFTEAAKRHPKDHDNAYQDALKRAGMARMEGETAGQPGSLFVCDCPELRGVLRNTQYATQNIVTLLGRLPGAERCRQRVAAGRAHGVRIPLQLE
ncbi:MAG: DUF3854 domain-containing protein [Betaproteobacteria bacterium]|nr:DUF3854 domain-containing protein [Betaproteobacteria bacterium]